MEFDNNPYVGPRPYKAGEEHLFFGRQREADDLLSLVISYQATLLYAQSGSGKTSLLNAALIPMLAGEGFETLPVARVRGPIPQGLDPAVIRNLYAFNVLTSWAGPDVLPSRLAALSLGDYLAGRERSRDREGFPLPLVLLFDQFEELFLLYPERAEERVKLLAEIAGLLAADRFLRVIFAMREDHLAELEAHAGILPEKLRGRQRLERLQREAALVAVTRPLLATRRRFAPAAADRLVEDLLKARVETASGETQEITGEFVEPVQLQVVCHDLWRQLPADVEEITVDHLTAFGDADRALMRFYEEAVEAAAVETGFPQEDLRAWCEQWLITTTGTRGMVHRGPASAQGVPNRALEVLDEHHLVRSEWRAGARWYELTHDRFVAPIRAANEAWKLQRQERAKQAYQLLLTGNQQVQSGLPEQAIAVFSAVIAMLDAPAELRARALVSRGVIHGDEGRPEEAIEDYSAVIAMPGAPADQRAQALVNRGVTYGEQGRQELELEDYTAAIAMPGAPAVQRARALVCRGLTYGEEGRLDEEIADYTEVIAMPEAPADQRAKALVSRGVTYGEQARPQEEIADYGAVIAMPDAPVEQRAQALVNRGMTYGEQGRLAEAIADFNTVIAMPDAPADEKAGALANRAWRRFTAQPGDLAGLREDSEAALAIEPELTTARFNLALALLLTGDLPRASAEYARAAREETDIEQVRSSKHDLERAIANRSISGADEIVALFQAREVELAADAEN